MPNQSNHGDIPPTLFLALLGAAGDLAWRRVVPALYDLYRDGGLPVRFALVAVDRKPDTSEALRAHYREGSERFSRLGLGNAATWEAFAARIEYLAADIEQAGAALAPRLAECAAAWGEPPLAVFYLAIPPQLFGPAARGLAAASLAADRERARLVVEKPLGRDLASFRALDAELGAHFQESQIYRMDHFLGKETVQNLLALRFANPIFEPIWDRRYIDHVAITVAETLAWNTAPATTRAPGRCATWCRTICCRSSAWSPWNRRPLRRRQSARPQDGPAHRPAADPGGGGGPVRRAWPIRAGWIHGVQRPGYRQEEGCARLQRRDLCRDQAPGRQLRWQDVPFYLRTGKRMAEDVSEVSIRFRPVPHQAWRPAPLATRVRCAWSCACTRRGHGPQAQSESPGAISPSSSRTCASPTARPSRPIRRALRNPARRRPGRGPEPVHARRPGGQRLQLLDPVLQSWAERRPISQLRRRLLGPESAERLINRDGRGWLTPTLPTLPIPPRS